MSVKSVLGTVTGFLTHHVADLNAVGGALNAILDSLAVNAETREHIATLIAKTTDSATAIAAFLENVTVEPDPVTIRESDIETALRNVVKSGALDGVIGQAVTEYNIAHPAPAPTAAPASFSPPEVGPAGSGQGGGATVQPSPDA